MRAPAPGTVLRWSHAYPATDLDAYAALTGTAPVTSPPLLPDLLVIAPLTKLGGDLDYLARTMTWTHHRPVAATERLTAELTVRDLTPGQGFTRIAFDSRVCADDGEPLASGRSKGLILDATPPPTDPPPTDPPPPSPYGPRRPPVPPLDPAALTPGTTLTGTTTVTGGDITRCADLTGDHGTHHTLGLHGRRLAQGLLTAGTLPLLRGDHDFHCTSVTAVFLQPVHADDTLRSATHIDHTTATTLTARASVRNQHDTEVLTAHFTGSFAPAPHSAAAHTEDTATTARARSGHFPAAASETAGS